ncbi:MAG: glycosyltransferase, partial [Verrucomicrobia bacterium]|nr:glycosyltransferase [Verrucomicrobiota bacterium]
MKRNIGIYLGSAPRELAGNQGIVKLLMSIMHSKEFRSRMVVALPSWSRNEFNKLIKELNLSGNETIEILSARKRKPILLSLREWVQRILNKQKKKKENKLKFAKKTFDALIKASGKNIFLFLLISPPLFIGASLYSIYKVFTFWLPKIKKKMHAILMPRIKRYFLDPFDKLKERGLGSRIFAAMREDETKKLVKLINKRDDIELWYIPTGYWPEVSEIKKRKVIAIPDIIFHDFPTIFSSHWYLWDHVYQNIKKTLTIDAHFLCYSAYVKAEHLMKPYQIEENKISVIKHGVDTLAIHLKKDRLSQTDQALKILEAYQKKSLKDDHYLSNFHLPNMKFLFYSSQVRPHKNIINLIKAYEILLRKRFINTKLILTGLPQHYEKAHSYIQAQHLQNDVISLFGVSSEVLAALNHLAVCAVNPTFFEGGFPFTFCEAYSVGTPSVMSRIPVVLEE